MEFTGNPTGPQSQPHRSATALDQWLIDLHRTVCDRVPHAWIRAALSTHCRTEAKHSAGWPALRLAGELPPGYHGDPYTIATHYRQALGKVLADLATVGALEVDLPRPPCDLAAMFQQGGMLR